MKKTSKKPKIHTAIKVSLGYASDETDREVLRDWKQRLSRVCKPCWELKYCPYGPFVEQSPLLPSRRSEVSKHIDYMKSCLLSGMMGWHDLLDDESKSLYEYMLANESILVNQALNELTYERMASASQTNPNEQFSRGLPPIHIYRVLYHVHEGTVELNKLSEPERDVILERVATIRKRYEDALKSGMEDYRGPLDQGRRNFFEKEVAEFDPEQYPDEVPQIFEDGACNIFGHICPVFFSAESITETESERRRGRYIPFATKMRIVRRDNHTCQICGVHLRDDEVEFDHIIPIARGGSSEEHNIRLTCYDCNRDKKDKVFI